MIKQEEIDSIIKQVKKEAIERKLKNRISPEWISVKDLLPKKDGRYLVNEKYSSNWIRICSLRDGKWDSDSVTHWMPLPDAPKE